MVCWAGACAANPHSNAAGSGGAFEPRAWPRALDVRMRVDMQYVVNTVSLHVLYVCVCVCFVCLCLNESGGAFKPRAWPRALDVRMRVDMQHVVNTVS